MLSSHNPTPPVNEAATLPSEAAAAERHSILVQHAFTAIDIASTVDEVKKVLDEWTGLAAYARKAKDKQLEADAAEIKMRAERRLGEMMQAQKETFGFHKGGGDQRSDHRVSKKPGDPPTLGEAGITKNLANKARKEAAKPKEKFEEDVAEKRSSILATKLKRRRRSAKRMSHRRQSAELRKQFDFEHSEHPKVIKTNLLDSLSHAYSVARAFKRISKGASLPAHLDEGAREEISRAIGRLISMWKSLQATLAPRPAGNGEAPAAGLDCSIPKDLSIPSFLKRTPTESVS
jgi:hypothetical protein